ncbi:hypothetical protein [Gemmobacter caeruleus]|uniref:hypothetical protein n=1 Tax=Gemmobacter caeruleus TaxID=2595004 RepID=UPI0011EFFC50|nr:hypothetical protein [Gemmobacter caeruleus]
MRSTALKQFTKLEATGLWREAPELQRREVVVSFGESSLTISDPRSESALSHWSLPAVERLNPGERPALFAPGQDALETLEIEDALMIEALERVRDALSSARPRPGRLRGSFVLIVSAAIALAMVTLAPGALVSHTASVLPPATRLGIGRMALADLSRVAGAPCTDPTGQGALDRLSTRLFGPIAPQILVLRDGAAQALHLPGGIITLHRDLIEKAPGPEIAAGYILAEAERATASDPVLPALRHAGFIATLRLLTTGALPPDALEGYGQALLLTPPADLPADTLLRRFGDEGIPATPYARSVDPTGETTLALIEADPMKGRAALPLMPDSDWLGLQAICAE